MFDELREGVDFVLNGLEEWPREDFKRIDPRVDEAGLFVFHIGFGFDERLDPAAFMPRGAPPP